MKIKKLLKLFFIATSRALVCLALVPVSNSALAQANYPNKPIRFVVGFAAGGSDWLIFFHLCAGHHI